VSWLSVAQAAKILQITPRSVQRRCDAGTLKARRVGPEGAQHWEIDPASVEVARDGATPNIATVAATRDTPLQTVAPQTSQEIQAVTQEVHQLRGEIEQLKSFIAGGAIQAINERLAQIPDAETLRKAIAENQGQTAQMMAQAVKSGITEALQADIERENEQQAQSASKDDVKDIVDRLERVLERQQWLEEDNANLRKELEERDKKRGFFGRFFGGG